MGFHGRHVRAVDERGGSEAERGRPVREFDAAGRRADEPSALLSPRIREEALSVASAPCGWHSLAMITLVEIERAAEALPPVQKTELLLFLAESLRKEQAPLPEPRLFSPEQLQAWMDEDEEAMRRFRTGA